LGSLYFPHKEQPDHLTKQQFPEQSLVDKQLKKVDISGAVVNPGVYSFSGDARLEDLIAQAGGLQDEANKDYVSKALNLSQKVSDGFKVYIPFKTEQPSTSVFTLEAASSSEVAGISTHKININSASSKELESLPGIGPVSAAKIISQRPYNNKEELVSKKTISKKTLEKINDLIELF
jgi:competence protein ComEA